MMMIFPGKFSAIHANQCLRHRQTASLNSMVGDTASHHSLVSCFHLSATILPAMVAFTKVSLRHFLPGFDSMCMPLKSREASFRIYFNFHMRAASTLWFVSVILQFI